MRHDHERGGVAFEMKKYFFWLDDQSRCVNCETPSIDRDRDACFFLPITTMFPVLLAAGCLAGRAWGVFVSFIVEAPSRIIYNYILELIETFFHFSRSGLFLAEHEYFFLNQRRRILRVQVDLLRKKKTSRSCP